MKSTSGIVTLIVVVGIFLGISPAAIAQDFPTRPISLVIPYGAGGSSSMSGRIIGQGFTQIMEEAMIIMNKPGGGGTIGASHVLKAKPDGYTLFLFNSGSNGVATLRKDKGYTNDDFQLIGRYAIGQAALAVRADAPWNTVDELVAYAKENPGKLKFPGGTGDTARFATELFKSEAGGLEIARIPVTSGAETNQMLLSGNAHLSCGPASDMRGLVDGGKLRFLAFCNEERNKDYPDVPTFKELGYPGIVISTWYGLATSSQVPQDVMTTLRDTIAKVMQDKEIHKMLNNIGHTPAYLSADEFRIFEKKMEKLYAKIALKAGIELK